MKKIISHWVRLMLVFFVPEVAFAADREILIERHLEPGNTPPILVSMSGFTGEAAQVLQFDLYVQGFAFTNADSAQYLLSGSNNGNVQGRASDRFSKATLVSKAYSGASLRRQAHAFADDFVNAIPGHKGIAQTRIAFKNDTGAQSDDHESHYYSA